MTIFKSRKQYTRIAHYIYPMTLHQLILWQSRYALVAIVYNIISALLQKHIGAGLTSTDPLMGNIVMVIYCLFLESGKRGFEVLYRILMLLAVLGLGYGGVITHLINLVSQPELYLNIWVGMLAVLINLIGLTLNLYGLFGRYR